MKALLRRRQAVQPMSGTALYCQGCMSDRLNLSEFSPYGSSEFSFFVQISSKFRHLSKPFLLGMLQLTSNSNKLSFL